MKKDEGKARANNAKIVPPIQVYAQLLVSKSFTWNENVADIQKY